MRNLIQSVPAAETAYLAGDDAAVVAAMNDPTIQVLATGNDRRPGYASNATTGIDLGQGSLGVFLTVLAGAIAANAGNGMDHVLSGFRDRFNTTPDGVNFADTEVRMTLSALLNAASVPDTPYLELGFILESAAQQNIGHPFDLADLLTAQKQQAILDIEAKGTAARNAAVSAMGGMDAAMNTAANDSWNGV